MAVPLFDQSSQRSQVPSERICVSKGERYARGGSRSSFFDFMFALAPLEWLHFMFPPFFPRQYFLVPCEAAVPCASLQASGIAIWALRRRTLPLATLGGTFGDPNGTSRVVSHGARCRIRVDPPQSGAGADSYLVSCELQVCLAERPRMNGHEVTTGRLCSVATLKACRCRAHGRFGVTTHFVVVSSTRVSLPERTGTGVRPAMG